ncbi:hypothetical protein MODO_1134 [Myroides odoratimimus]|uniref:hypothetical protein n=1 Tax=Myroides odoratimimus TaxID=76832 RepID=UPI00072862DF|nr:hypothetical protein [Myroides odoratimimus]GAQ13479.1 hypothetical protein MODO_1134 [Myroides odoratimimus]STZ48031.1 Uncharacterised protein [Myroides odoratimimus]
MIFTELNAAGYEHNITFYQNEFEDILRGIIVCYNNICSSNITLPNDENEIRNVILRNYLKNNSFKKANFNLSNYHFDYETIENKGRADIRILPINPYLDDHAYYIIECKRLRNQNLNGTTGLNAEYVKNGVCRFVTDYYSSYFSTNGMIGFVVDDMCIDKNIYNLNSLLIQDLINDRKETVNAKLSQEMISIKLSNEFDYSYKSKHKLSTQNEVTLYHLMFNFSTEIQ